MEEVPVSRTTGLSGFRPCQVRGTGGSVRFGSGNLSVSVAPHWVRHRYALLTAVLGVAPIYTFCGYLGSSGPWPK